MTDESVQWFDAAGGWLVTRYDDVQRVLTDWRTFSSAAPPADLADWFLRGRPMRPVQPMSIVGMDPPEHGPHRRIVVSLLSPERVASLEPSVHRIARELLGPIEGQTSCDLVDSYTAPLPLMVLAEILGIDPARHRSYRRWAEAVPRTDNEEAPGGADARKRDLREFDEFFDEFGQTLLAERCETDLGRLVHAGDLTLEEAVRFAKLLLLAGSSTTSHLIANAVVVLLIDRDRLEALAARPHEIESFVASVLKAEPPVQTVARVATRPVSIGGVDIPAGARVLAAIGAANREQPARRSLSMGTGPHVCPGGDLGMMEAVVALAHLLPLLSRATLAHPVRYYASARIKAPQRLALTIAPYLDTITS